MSVPEPNNSAFVATGFSLLVANDQAIVDLAGTWNTSGTPTAIKLNITDTASNAASKLFDLQVGAATKFAVDKTGSITFADGIRQTFNPNGTNAGINVGANAADPSAPVNGDLWYQSIANELRARINGATVALGAGGGASPPFDDGTAIIKGSADATKLLRIEVDGFTTGTTRIATPPNQDFTIAGTNVAQTFTVEQTFTPAANTEAITVTGFSLTGANAQSILDLTGTWNTSGQPSAIKLNITDTASIASSFLLDMRVGGVQKFYVQKDGSFVSGSFSVSADGSFSAGGDFVVAADGSFIASTGAFMVDATGNAQVFNTLTFGESGNTIFDDTGLLTLPAANSRVGSAPFYDSAGFFGVNSLQISSGIELTNESGDLRLSGSIYFGVNAVGAIGIVADAYIQVIDGTGAAYKILCVAV